MIKAGQIIAGRLSRKSLMPGFQGLNPSTGEALEPHFFDATAEEIEEAVLQAHDVFNCYRKRGDEQRAQFLETIALNMEALGGELQAIVEQETALPKARISGELARTTGQLRFFADLIRKPEWRRPVADAAQPERLPLPRPAMMQFEVPVGPVAVFGASNFPLAFSVAGGDTASALAAGCPVIFKAHPAHPATCQLVGHVIAEAARTCGLPAAVFSLLHGKTHDVGMQLVANPLIKAVSFTGSFRGGKAIFDKAVSRPDPVPVYAEMGSVNPVFFLPDALSKGGRPLARKFADSITLGAGQFCTNPGLSVLIDSPDSRAFIAAVNAELAGSATHPMLTPEIAEAYRTGVDKLQRMSGTSRETSSDNAPKPCLIQTDLAQVKIHKDYLEEVFGPASVAVLVSNEKEMSELVGLLPGQLTGTVHAGEDDGELAREIIELLTYKAGRIVWNGFPTGVEVCNAMVHGGPFPASTDSRSTSVGATAIYRFTRPVCYQNIPASLLPGITQNVDFTKKNQNQ